MSKEHWQKLGKLYPCPNKAFYFNLGKYLVALNWAKDKWAAADSSGNLENFYLKVSSKESPDGIKMRIVILFKLSITFGYSFKE